MKILNFNSVRGLVLACLVLTIAFAVSVKSDDKGAKLEKSQVAAFPNNVQAPTSADQIPKSKFTAPKLSAALNELDPTKKIRKPEFLQTIKYALYELTRGEMETIFAFADQNKDDTVDQKEWGAFITLFVLPFEACNKKGNNLLDLAEFKACFDADPRTKLVQFRRRNEKNHHELMMNVVSTRGAPVMNFSDYLFLRKSLYGWQQCQSNAKYIAKVHFKCAIAATLPTRYYSKLDFETIYNVGLKIANDRNLLELDFINYLRTLHYANVYGLLNLSGNSAELERQSFLKAIKEDRIPNNFEESEVKLIYSLINSSPTVLGNKVDSMNFETFSFFYTLHILFNKYSVARPLHLSQAEFLKMLEDPLVLVSILNAVDASNTGFDEAAYQEASLILQKYRLNEKDFFNARFKQDASVTTTATGDAKTINANADSVTAVKANREVFFSIFTETNKQFLVKRDLFRAFQLANLFVNIGGSSDIAIGKLLDNLPSTYDKVTPVMNMAQRNNYVLYKNIPREIKIDILTFLSLENFAEKLKLQTMMANVHIDETQAKIILKDFGMINMPDTVIDIAQSGFDSLHRRIYSPFELCKSAIIVQSVASENKRNLQQFTSNKLKPNKERSREFPAPNRRFLNSGTV